MRAENGSTRIHFRGRAVWLFSPHVDLLAFLAPALISLLLCAGLAALGRLDRPLATPGWLILVVLVDVAHVYATVYRVYANPAEMRRRPVLYAGVPVLCYGLGVLCHAVSPLCFWRALAYLAVVHFVRQQYGWIALCGRRGPRSERPDRLLDAAAIYAGTLYPLLWWHAHLPRRFHWFVSGDFAALVPPGVLTVATPLWAAIGLLWTARQVQQGLRSGCWNVTRILVMTGTWATWYAGIVAWDSDVAFTLTNVLVHGVPYLLVVWRYHVRESGQVPGPRQGTAALSLLMFYVPLALLAFLEEGIWDRLVWHEHAALYPLPAFYPGPGLLLFLVPLLALPQSTHYLLDAFIWRSGRHNSANPDLGRYLGLIPDRHLGYDQAEVDP